MKQLEEESKARAHKEFLAEQARHQQETPQVGRLLLLFLISNNLQPGSRAEPPEGAHYPGLSEIEVCHGHESHSVSTWNVGV
jgi:hypothetical protein